jgi:hypothetical protein
MHDTSKHCVSHTLCETTKYLLPYFFEGIDKRQYARKTGWGKKRTLREKVQSSIDFGTNNFNAMLSLSHPRVHVSSKSCILWYLNHSRSDFHRRILEAVDLERVGR